MNNADIILKRSEIICDASDLLGTEDSESLYYYFGYHDGLEDPPIDHTAPPLEYKAIYDLGYADGRGDLEIYISDT